MLRMSVAGLLFALVSACTAPTPSSTITVSRDMGGLYLDRVSLMQQARDNHQRIEIRGTCASACTLYLGMPERTCVFPSARLGFHGPQQRISGTRFIEVPEPARTQIITRVAAHYPPAFRAWFLEHAAHLSGQRLAWMSGREAIAMGARPCKA